MDYDYDYDDIINESIDEYHQCSHMCDLDDYLHRKREEQRDQVHVEQVRNPPLHPLPYHPTLACVPGSSQVALA